jgi:hypothetical protein
MRIGEGNVRSGESREESLGGLGGLGAYFAHVDEGWHAFGEESHTIGTTNVRRMDSGGEGEMPRRVDVVVRPLHHVVAALG